MRRLLTLVLTLALAACAAPMASRQAAAPVRVDILALNDFHGNLEPPRVAESAADGKGGSVVVPAGGAASLGATITALRGANPNTVVVAAGDLIGASPLVSSYYLDEPTIGVMNRIGLEFSSVGNHEFDRGTDELLRMQNGGCEKFTSRTPCRLERFAGAKFRYLAASTLTADGRTLFPATGLRSFGEGARKVTVGFVGLTLRATPTMVTPGGIRGLRFGDEADAVNAAVPGLLGAGADAIVVLIHQGGQQGVSPHDPNGCERLAGGIMPILARLDPRVDVVISGHTHQDYVCDYAAFDPQRRFLLTSAGYYGRLVTDITLEIDPAANRVVAKRARNEIVRSPAHTGPLGPADDTGAGAPRESDAAIAAYIEPYSRAVAALAARPVGKLAGPATRKEDAPVSTGGALGRLIADAQLAATRPAGAQIAFMNTGGIRADLTPAADGTVTFGQIHAVQPFGNQLVTITLSGAQLRRTLEQGLARPGTPSLLIPSQGFVYAYDLARPAGERITAMTLNGAPIAPEASYRVTLSSFLAQAGDGYSGFTAGTDPVTGPLDLDALAAWLAHDPARPVPAQRRIVGAVR